MRINVIAFSTNGCRTAKRLKEAFPEEDMRIFAKTQCDTLGVERVEEKASEWTGKSFEECDAIVYIGAIGIARAFAFGGSRGRAMHIPSESFKENMTEEEYFANQGTSVNHFHEKLLKLKDMMNTESAKRLAQARHEYMERFLEEFMDEWDGRR